MYSIVLTDGKIINVDANNVVYDNDEKMIKFFNDRRIVSRINMDNIVGWIESKYRQDETYEFMKKE